MPLDLTYGKSTLVQVMAWCHQATSHYLSQCWPRSMSPNGITRPHWVKSPCAHLSIKSVFPVMGISIIKIRQSWHRLIFVMGIAILKRQYLYIEMAPWWPLLGLLFRCSIFKLSHCNSFEDQTSDYKSLFASSSTELQRFYHMMSYQDDSSPTSAWQLQAITWTNINPLRAKFFRVNINIYLYFVSFLHTNKTRVVEIPPRVRQGPTYSA